MSFFFIPIDYVKNSTGAAGSEEGFDIRKLIPAPTNTEEDAGPYITMDLCYASDPETKAWAITIHRLCLQSKDEIFIYFVPGTRHLACSEKRPRPWASLSPSPSVWA